MADDKKKPDKTAAPAQAEGAAPRRKTSIRVIAIVAGLMAAEAGGVYFFMGLSGGHAQTAQAKVEGAEEHAAQETDEIELIDDKFQNMQTGHVWVWDMAIVLKAKHKNAEFIETQLAKRNAEIKEGISQIIRRAQHSQLREPDLTTVNRQIAAYLDTIIKPDEATGASRIERVLIPKCKGLQID